MTLPLLLFAIGNESRGDDALGPLLLRQLQTEGLPPEAEMLEDFQLQIEHTTDLVGRRAVLFVDADMSCTAPFQLSAITAQQDRSYTSHAMTPSALLQAYRTVYAADAPPAQLLRIRGYGFELGARLSPQASQNMHSAYACIRTWLEDQC